MRDRMDALGGRVEIASRPKRDPEQVPQRDPERDPKRDPGQPDRDRGTTVTVLVPATATEPAVPSARAPSTG
jgi:hypothetical protein